MTSPSRPYRGRSAADRQAERRARLLSAATDIWGEHGWAAVTMRGVSARAGLTGRYFYESFEDTDALLAAVWDQVLDEEIRSVLDALANAGPEPRDQLLAAIAAFVHAMTADPRKARIGFGDHAGSAILEQRRREAHRTFTTLMIEQAGLNGIDPADPRLRLTAMIAVGGIREVITNWLAGNPPLTADQLIEYITDIGVTAAAPLLAAVTR